MKIHILKFNQKIANLRKIIKESVLFLLILALIWQCFPRITSLAAFNPQELTTPNEQIIEEMNNLIKDLGQPVKVLTVPVTAYNSLPGQTDSTPCITANGFNLCNNNTQNVIATNFLPFGAKVRFPDYDPDTIYTVQDRLNARYYYRADIWMKTVADARSFGIKRLKIEVYQ